MLPRQLLRGLPALLAALLVALAARPDRLDAAKLRATVNLTADEESELTAADRSHILGQLQANWNTHRDIAGKQWRCADTLSQEQSGRPAPVSVDVSITRRTAVERAFGGDYRIEVRLSVAGQGSDIALDRVEVDEHTEDADMRRQTVQELARRAGDKLAVLLQKYSPCTPKAKMTVRAEAGGEGIMLAIVIDAEGDLDLSDDGTVDTSLPVTASFQVSGLCSGTMPYSDARLMAKGAYSDDDGALQLQLAFSGGTQTGSFTCAGVTCTVGGGSFSCPIPALGALTGFHDRPVYMDLSEGGPLTVALRDGAAASIPVPAGMEAWGWNGSLQLTYGTSGAAAAALVSTTELSSRYGPTGPGASGIGPALLSAERRHRSRARGL